MPKACLLAVKILHISDLCTDEVNRHLLSSHESALNSSFKRSSTLEGGVEEMEQILPRNGLREHAKPKDS